MTGYNVAYGDGHGAWYLDKEREVARTTGVLDQTTQSTVYGGNVLLKFHRDAVFLVKIKGQFWCIVRNS